ncbi:MAG: AAA family ATPase, partial [Candidatus Cloacimonetes bacterium]|nr:AAA family ATPase [Candidatus Cloacimonadota bacterium]
MPLFKKIKGQDKAVGIIRHAIENSKVASTHLFYGPDGVGKFTTALYFGMAMNCDAHISVRPCGMCNSCRKFISMMHPDFVYIFPTPNLKMTEEGEITEKKFLTEFEDYKKNKTEHPWREFKFSANTEIRINDIRMLQHRINMGTVEARCRFMLIEHADRMNEKAANAFLKTLEEPPENSLIILTTTKPNSLLPTILSRCQKVQFLPLPRGIIETYLEENDFVEKLEAKIFSRIANGNIEKAINLAEEKTLESRKEMLDFLNMILEGDEISIIEFVDNFRGSKSGTFMERFISHLIIWFSDVAIYASDYQDIINMDQTELLERFYSLSVSCIDRFNELIGFLEEMKYKLGNNVTPQLVIIEIYNRIKAC